MRRNRLLGDRDRPNRFVETEKAKNHCYLIIFDGSQNHKIDPNHKINKINKWTNQKVNRNQIILLIIARFSLSHIHLLHIPLYHLRLIT